MGWRFSCLAKLKSVLENYQKKSGNLELWDNGAAVLIHEGAVAVFRAQWQEVLLILSLKSDIGVMCLLRLLSASS